MHEDAIDPLELGHFQEGIEVGLLRVHSTIRHQPEQMQATAAGAGVLHRRDQGGVGEQLSILNH